MEQDQTFKTFHLYNRLVRRSLVKPLTHSCGTTYTLGLGDDDELILRCLACDERVVPGMDTIGNVRAVVKEHFPDD